MALVKICWGGRVGWGGGGGGGGGGVQDTLQLYFIRLKCSTGIKTNHTH